MDENQAETLADQVFHSLLKLHQTFRRDTRQMIDERDLTPRDFSVMRYLLDLGRATVGQIQAYVHKSASTTSALITQMEEKGFVTRTRSRKDNRVVHVALTAKGKEIVETTPMSGLPLLRRQLRTRSDSRLVEMLGVLDEISTLIETEDNR